MQYQAIYLACLLGIGFPLVGQPARAATDTNDAAAASDNQAAKLDEIIVTAQKRPENIQSVPIGITALSAATLEQSNTATLQDLSKLVPSAVIQVKQGTSTTYLRGVGDDNAQIGNEPSVPVYVDGVYYSRLTSVRRLDDIADIEVLKGPQGTLFGRNASAGVIQITTRTPEPGSAPTFDTSVGLGNYGATSVTAYGASGLTPTIGADLAFSYYGDRGFGTNLYTGDPANYDRSISVRSKWVFQPADSTRIVAAFEYGHMNSDLGILGQYPGGPYPGFGNTGLPLGGGLLPGMGFFDRNTNTPEDFVSTSYGGYLRAAQTLSFATLSNIAAYHRDEDTLYDDSDTTPQKFQAAALYGHTYQFTNELQLVSNAGSPVAWTAGAFYLDISQGYQPGNLSGPGYTGPSGLVERFYSASPTKSYAIYAQATIPIVSKWKVTLGGRYSRDDLDANGTIQLVSPTGVVVRTVIPQSSVHEETNKPSWRGALEYQANDNVMTYLSASQGYKSGLWNTLPFVPTSKFIQPEVLTAYEFGVKSETLDSRLRLNGAIFDYRIKDPQTIVVLNTLPTLVNSGASEVKGAEIEGQALPGNNLTLRLGASYLDATYTDFPNAAFYSANPNPPFGLLPPVTGNGNGYVLPRAPKYSGNAGVDYRIPTSHGELALDMNYAYTAAYYWSNDNRIQQGAYGILDAQISYAIAHTGATVKLWGRNLSNKFYVTTGLEQAGSVGDSGAPGAPRQYGVTFSYKY